MSQGTSYGYSRSHRALELLAIFGTAATIVWIIASLMPLVDDGVVMAWAAAAALLGFVLADFTTGLVHWAADTVGTEEWPLVGRAFIFPFRDHHRDEKAITRHDFVETNGNNCIFALPTVLPLAFLIPEAPGVGAFCIGLWTSTIVFTMATNQFHKWSHMDEPPRFVATLHSLGLILTPAHHAHHHTAPHRTHYCITNGWLNPLLDFIRIWRVLEWCIRLGAPWAITDPAARAEAAAEEEAREAVAAARRE